MKNNIFGTSMVVIIAVLLIIFGVMRGDPGRYIGGDTPIMTIAQIMGGLYLLYLVFVRKSS